MEISRRHKYKTDLHKKLALADALEIELNRTKEYIPEVEKRRSYFQELLRDATFKKDEIK